MRRVTEPAERLRRAASARPLYRIGLRILLLALTLGSIYPAAQLSRSPLGQSLLKAAADKLVQDTGLLGMTVSDIRVEGRETTDRETILAALDVGPSTPILAVSPTRTKDRLEALPWVRTAVIERWLPGTIYVRLVERQPLALWQHGGKIELIDHGGEVIPVVRLDQFAKLLMVVGEGAARHAAELLQMLASEPELAARVTAAIRVGDRRWNLRIDNAIDVLLPAHEEANAWSQLARLERSSAILKRDLQTIDLRLPDRLVLRVSPEFPKEVPISKKSHSPAKNT